MVVVTVSHYIWIHPRGHSPGGLISWVFLQSLLPWSCCEIPILLLQLIYFPKRTYQYLCKLFHAVQWAILSKGSKATGKLEKLRSVLGLYQLPLLTESALEKSSCFVLIYVINNTNYYSTLKTYYIWITFEYLLHSWLCALPASKKKILKTTQGGCCCYFCFSRWGH